MSSYTLQLGPVQPCSGPGKVTHVIHGADQLQLLFCGSGIRAS